MVPRVERGQCNWNWNSLSLSPSLILFIGTTQKPNYLWQFCRKCCLYFGTSDRGICKGRECYLNGNESSNFVIYETGRTGDSIEIGQDGRKAFTFVSLRSFQPVISSLCAIVILTKLLALIRGKLSNDIMMSFFLHATYELATHSVPFLLFPPLSPTLWSVSFITFSGPFSDYLIFPQRAQPPILIPPI